MNFRKLLSIFLICIIAIGLFSGCGDNKADNQHNSLQDGNNSNDSTKPDTITVAELKNKFGDSDAGKILPLYNLDASKPLTIALKYTPKNEREVFSIHTDEKCLKESEIALMWSVNSYDASGPKTYEVKPINAPLSNTSTQGLWGNVSNYFIKFNYDIEAETETKLDKPIIVPMSVKSPVEIPNISYEIKNGCLSISWDKVDGATGYRIYNRSADGPLSTSDVPLTGKESGFSGGAIPLLVAELDANTFSYDDWMKDGNSGISKFASKEVLGGYITSYQNQGVSGEYYVTVLIDGKESFFSMGVSTNGLPLPHSFKKGTSILSNTYESPAELPHTVSIEYTDASVHSHNISYEAKPNSTEITYYVEGTVITGYVIVKNESNTISRSDYNNDSTAGGVSKSDNNIPQNAPPDMPTIGEEHQTPNDDKPDGTPDTIPEKTVIEQQIEATEKTLEEANKQTIEVNNEIVINADSAFKEYLALNLIAGKTEISVAAFPEMQCWSILSDVLSEVIYQNPFVLGVSSYGYNYGKMMLLIEYKYSQEEIAIRQKEIIAEGNKVVGSIISNNMSDEEKRHAIYNYLEANTSYDEEALANAKANNLKPDNKYRDSFTTYGVLVNKVGVCQSYALVYDYLCELANVECIIVTGLSMNNLPHAWNKVKINGEWLTTDVTNNVKNTGIEYFMYENPDHVVAAFGYKEDEMYYTNDKEGSFKGTSVEYSKFKNSIISSDAELEAFIEEKAKKNSTLEFIVTFDGFTTNDLLDALKKAEVSQLGDASVMIGGFVHLYIK